MGIKKVKPTTNARRQMIVDDFADITAKASVKKLLKTRKQKSGRNSSGKITIRHRGGGAKRMIRIIDFKRDKFDVPAVVATIEYDPGRGARIALLNYKDGEKRYMVAPAKLKVGDEVVSSQKKVGINPGNAMPIKYIPAGIAVFNVELEPGRGAKIARGAGNRIAVMGVEGTFAQIQLPSREIRLIKKECMCTIGQASNADRRHFKIGKAGRKRLMGWRPTVRGSAMNPVDHPHGGGEGNQPIGLKHPKTPWGKPALGVKTRRKKPSDKLIIKRRKRRRR